MARHQNYQHIVLHIQYQTQKIGDVRIKRVNQRQTQQKLSLKPMMQSNTHNSILLSIHSN